MVIVDLKGHIKRWFFSDGDVGGNPNGNVAREVTVTEDLEIHFEEQSWGKNTELYQFEAIYLISEHGFKGSDFTPDIKKLCMEYISFEPVGEEFYNYENE